MFNLLNAGAYRAPQLSPSPTSGLLQSPGVLPGSQQGQMPGMSPWYGQFNWMTGGPWAQAPYGQMPTMQERMQGQPQQESGGGALNTPEVMQKVAQTMLNRVYQPETSGHGGNPDLGLKRVYANQQEGGRTTWYKRDAQGNIVPDYGYLGYGEGR